MISSSQYVLTSSTAADNSNKDNYIGGQSDKYPDGESGAYNLNNFSSSNVNNQGLGAKGINDDIKN